MFRLCTCLWHLHFGPTFRGRCSLLPRSLKPRISAPAVSIYDARSFGWLIKLMTELESSSRMFNSEDHTGSCSFRLANRIKKIWEHELPNPRSSYTRCPYASGKFNRDFLSRKADIETSLAKLLASCSNISSIAQNYSRWAPNFLQLSKNSI